MAPVVPLVRSLYLLGGRLLPTPRTVEISLPLIIEKKSTQSFHNTTAHIQMHININLFSSVQLVMRPTNDFAVGISLGAQPWGMWLWALGGEAGSFPRGIPYCTPLMLKRGEKLGLPQRHTSTRTSTCTHEHAHFRRQAWKRTKVERYQHCCSIALDNTFAQQ